jgi:hypothetical protein
MKKPVNSVIFRTTAGLLMLVGFVVSVQAQTAAPHVHTERCAHAGVEQLLRQRNPARAYQAQLLERQLAEYQRAASARQVQDNTVYRIPVVVHIIHNNSSNFVGGANNPNISDEQIQSQIRVLNEDYRRKQNTPGFNTSPIGADVGIEFYLANTDPQGRATNGVTRTFHAAKTVFDPFEYSDLVALSNIAYWPSNRYLNIWVTTLLGSTIGYGQLPAPADTLRGLQVVDEKIDGVVITHTLFGSNACTPNFRLYCQGRTTTHEVGHWLGLLHTWGYGDCGDDFVYDTPPTQTGNSGTGCGPINSECVPGRRTRNLTENYMDYSPDACMNLFTIGQRARMRAVLAVSPRRRELVASVNNPLPETEQLNVVIAPNPVPVQTSATAEVTLKGSQAVKIRLYDTSGKLLWEQPEITTISTRVSVPVTGLPKGMYVVQATTATEKASARLLVQ